MGQKRIQEIFDSLQDKKIDLASLKKDRHEQILIETEGYEGALSDKKDAADAVGEMEEAYDRKFPGLAEKIEKLSEETKDLADQLGSYILSALMKGEEVKIETKDRQGKKKTLRPKFKVSFERQQSLGI